MLTSLYITPSLYLFLYLLNAWHLGMDTSSHVSPTTLLLHLEVKIREFRTEVILKETDKKEKV